MTKAKDNPGPKYMLPSTIGSDNHDPTRSRAPGFSMGSRRNYSYKAGPGPYMIDGDLTNKGRVSKDGFTIKGKHKNSMWSVNETPGPNFAASQPINYPNSPRFSFGRPVKHDYKTGIPGPNAYDIPSIFGQGRKTTLNGRAKRGFAYDYAKTPGPIYNYGSVSLSSGPAFSIGGRFKPTKPKTVTPAPNTYMPPMNGTVKNSPRFSMGVYHHEDVIPLADVD